MEMSYEAVMREDARRRALKAAEPPYDPMTGRGCFGERKEVEGVLLPKAVADAHPNYAALSPVERDRLRITEDFEYWCVRAAVIQDKVTGRNVPLVLNPPQRRLLAAMERQRQAGDPIRIILLKARQWGGSTLVQEYMAWMQLVRHKGWNSLICGHLKTTSRGIKHMYSRLLRNYPRELLDDPDMELKFRNMEGDTNVQRLEARDCLVVTASAQTEDLARGYNVAMAHLSEVAFWADSLMHSPDDVVRSVCGTVLAEPETVVVMESTADGVGSYFHSEWLRAKRGESDKTPIFVPWYEIPIYRREVKDPEALWRELDEYELNLFETTDITLDQLCWYHYKRREYRQHSGMQTEYPSTDTEAFVANDNRVFAQEGLEVMRENDRRVAEPFRLQAAFRVIQGARVVSDPHGDIRTWAAPVLNSQFTRRYMVTVDVGGRSEKSDFSVIAVWDLRDWLTYKPEIVAQWRGHCPHIDLAWMSAQIAEAYDHALLVVESNSLESERNDDAAPQYTLEILRRNYRNLYYRQSGKPGFQTNRETKVKMINTLIDAVREHGYIERDEMAIEEMETYVNNGGRYEAQAGHHDDILMTRAIGLYIAKTYRPVMHPASSEPRAFLAH